MDGLRSWDSLKYNWLVWFLCGMSFPKTRRLAYLLYTIAFNFFITFGYTFSLTVAIFAIDDTETLLSNLAITNKSWNCSLKYLCALMQVKSLRQLEPALDELDSFATIPIQRMHLKEALKKSYGVFNIFAVIYGLVWLFSGTSMLLQMSRGNIFYPGWYPVDWENSKLWLGVVTFYQFLGIGLEILAHLGNDTYPSVLFIALYAHYRILEAALADFQAGTAKNQQENYAALIRCIQYHRKIGSVFQAVAQTMSLLMFLQYISTGFNLCLIAVSVTFFELDAAQKAYFYLYGLSVTIEMFGPCYFGNELIWESDRLTTHLFSCNWVDQDAKFKKALLIFMLNSQEPKVVKAGNFVDLSLASFVSVMKFSYSLFALLNGMQT